MSFSFAGLPGSACPRCGSLGFARFDLDLQCVDCGHGDVPADRLRDPPDEWLQANWDVSRGGFRWDSVAKTLGFSPDATKRCWVTKWSSLEIVALNEQGNTVAPSPLYVPLTNRTFAWLCRRMLRLAESDDRHVERLLDLTSIVTRCIEAGLADPELADPDNWPRLRSDDPFNPFSHLDLAYNAVRIAMLDWDDSKLWVDSSLWVDPTLDGESRSDGESPRIGGCSLPGVTDKSAVAGLTNEEKKVKASPLF